MSKKYIFSKPYINVSVFLVRTHITHMLIFFIIKKVMQLKYT
ncbi:hypothetical protein F4694_001080 [Bacillus niacini]|uniref:Uncharacterized protein n=1 Tax=Neobacillus niacini TaxID=86668 RepID=A0A852T954_9BACI|nr:hypothetical protein [Neobacillus niacini]